MPDNSNNEVVKVRVASLKAHPRQAEVFHDLSEEEVQALAEDMRLHGQQTPVEILPNGTIICGHQRVRAALLLEWQAIEVKFRRDLKALGEGAVFERLVSDNLVRRQLDQLGVARCYAALKENAKKLPGEKRGAYEKVDLRDRLAGQFNMSGRNLDRWVKVLGTPIAVQEAVSKGRLSLVTAGRVAGLHKDVKAMIAQEIGLGKDPEEVVRQHLPKPAQKKVDNNTALWTFFRHLQNDLPDLAARSARLPPLKEDQVALLESARRVIDGIMQRCRTKEVASAQQVAEVAEVSASPNAE